MADVTILDHPEGYPARDPGDMLGHIQALGRQVRDAFNAARALPLPVDTREARSVVLVGMGGSAIAAGLAAALAEPLTTVPIVVQREYAVPNFVDANTLVIAVSYSGTSEEMLSAVNDAHERGARLVAVTTGGELAERARAWGSPLYQFTYTSQPRAALGYTFGGLLGLLTQLGILPDPSADLQEAEAVLGQLAREIGPGAPTTRNPAKKLASELMGDFPVVYAAAHLVPVARRWKAQFNETSKSWAALDVFPELTHNSIAGFTHPPIAPEDVFVILLDSELYHPRVRAAFAPTLDLLAQANIAEITIAARGQSALAQQLGLVHFGDYVSYYLALLNDVDPTPTPAITYLKSKLG